MSNGLVTFTWSVPIEGHRWRCGHGDEHLSGECPDPLLLELADPRLADRRLYEPFEENPALYREFAKVEPTQEGVIAFADNWGPLFGWEGFADPAQPTGRQAEMLSAWRRAVSEMRSAVELWDVLRGGTPEKRLGFLQARVVRVQGPDGSVTLYYDTHADLSPDTKEVGDGYMRVRMPVGGDLFGDEGSPSGRVELSRPARVFLCRLASRALRGQVSPVLIPDPGKIIKILVPVMASIRLVPGNLVAALWLQFAYAMSSDKEQRLCPSCGEWFQLEKGKRSDRAYCTDACRKKVYRQRRQRAHQLHAAGKKVKEIAQELKADVASVKKWISDKKG
jgi:hypothetical protein